MSVISPTTKKLIHIPIPYLGPWRAMCMMKIPTENVDLMRVSHVGNFKVNLGAHGGGHGGRVVTLSPPTSFPGTASSGKAGSCLPLVGSLQYRTLTN